MSKLSMAGPGTGRADANAVPEPSAARLKRAWSAAAKSGAVARITLRQQLAYKADFAFRSAFLLLILYIFSQLWSSAYGGSSGGAIAGFTLKDIIWYLVFTEALTMAVPSVCGKVEEEVKSGDVAIRLLRPMSYVGYHFGAFLSEAALRMAVNLAAGGAIAWAIVGPPALGLGWLGLIALSIGALTLSYLLHMAVALLAFWVEETRGLEFVLNKLKFTVGGMLMPIDLMPDWLQRVCGWLPFQSVLYAPARMAVQYDGWRLVADLISQAAWAIALTAVVTLLYRRGKRRLHANGG